MDTFLYQNNSANLVADNNNISTYNHHPHYNNHNPFKSFWMAGFECTDQLNAFGNRVDLLKATGHIEMISEDYQQLSVFGMATVREGIRWSQVEKVPYQYDWSSVAAMITAGKQNNIQQVWDICHFGYPDDLTPLHPMFARRFAAVCRAFVKFYRSIDPYGTLIVTPINEVSFISWLGGDVRGTSPYCIGQGWEVKYSLMKAFIEGIEVMKEIDPTVRILTTEPLVNIIPPANATAEQLMEAVSLNEGQYQVTEILCGSMCPELRGKPEYLDILGYNYYFDNQWVSTPHKMLEWAPGKQDEGFVPLHKLLEDAYRRYRRPIVITETSHPKEDRPLWIEMIGEEATKIIDAGLPLWGICWYPIIDRPDWDNLQDWHQSGLWDGEFISKDIPRIINTPAMEALLKVQASVQVHHS